MSDERSADRTPRSGANKPKADKEVVPIVQNAGVASGFHEETIADLQMRLTYQEDEIRHLNQALEHQRTDLDNLKREIAHIKQQIAAMVPPEAGNRDEGTPPHY